MRNGFLGASLFWVLIASGQNVAQFSDPLQSGGHGPQMVTIAPGEFQMGCASGILCAENQPVHAVRLIRPFALSVHEITKGQFRTFVERTGYRPDSERPGAMDIFKRLGCVGFVLSDFRAFYHDQPRLTARKLTWENPGHPQSEDHPVVCVTWSDAMAYIEWLASETGRPYRLPSEAEWEYAARADHPGTNLDQSMYCEPPRGGLLSYECYGEPYTERVGHHGPNAFGLYDMERNAAEWVEDCWNPTFQNAPQDGSAWLAGRCEQRVSRGGGRGSYYVPVEVRGESQNKHTAVNLSGFRVAQSPTD